MLRRRERATASVGTAGVRVTPVLETRPDPLLPLITEDLAASDTGVAFVYRSLDRVKTRFGVDDVVVIIDDSPLGRQVFRAGRRPLDGAWAEGLVRTGETGLHVQPGGSLDAATGASVTNLCALALRLDVARHDALHDPLTGLLNRRSFDDLLDSTCAQSRRYGWSFAVVLIDLDRFKSVNDRLGHAAGDATLRAIGTELRLRLRTGDIAARVGGDEFALILPNGDDILLRTLIERLQRAVDIAVPEAAVSLTAGIASVPADGTDPTEIYRLADLRLYEGKHV